MTSPRIETVPPAEAERAIATIVIAFSTDPIARWAYPSPDKYLTYFPAVVRAFTGRAFENGTAFSTDDFCAAALWLPPGIAPDGEAMGAILDESVDEALQAEMNPFLEQMDHYHPQEPLWYLPMIGVDPTRQGRGYGSALLKHSLALCDREGSLSYLESTNPRNNPLYERYGFEAIGLIKTDHSPPMWPMLRKPR